ncbi:hypothetical protein VTN02DRAFT_5568 [Thermoascus thermophilus]
MERSQASLARAARGEQTKGLRGDAAGERVHVPQRTDDKTSDGWGLAGSCASAGRTHTNFARYRRKRGRRRGGLRLRVLCSALRRAIGDLVSARPRMPAVAAALAAVAVEAETCHQAQIPIVPLAESGLESTRGGQDMRTAGRSSGSSRASAAALRSAFPHCVARRTASLRRPIKAGTRPRELLVPSVASSVKTRSGSYDRITLTALIHHRLDGACSEP